MNVRGQDGKMYAAISLVVAAVIYRLAMGFAGTMQVGWLQNFSPMAAIALCGAIFLPKRLAFALPMAALLASDLLLNAFRYHVALVSWVMLAQYGAFAMIAGIGWSMRGRPGVGRVLGASVLGSVVFYLVTNTGAWIYQPLYPRDFAGWLQALTVGLPGYEPTWLFFRNTLLSDLGFTALFLAVVGYRRPVEEREALEAETVRVEG